MDRFLEQIFKHYRENERVFCSCPIPPPHPPRLTFLSIQQARTFLRVGCWVGLVTGVQYIKARDAAKHPPRPRTGAPPQQRAILSQMSIVPLLRNFLPNLEEHACLHTQNFVLCFLNVSGIILLFYFLLLALNSMPQRNLQLGSFSSMVFLLWIVFCNMGLPQCI